MRSLTKWSVADYQHMRDLGILNHRRCELINGEIWDMAPKGAFHRFVNHRGVNYLREVMNGRAEIFEAHPITLANTAFTQARLYPANPQDHPHHNAPISSAKCHTAEHSSALAHP